MNWRCSFGLHDWIYFDLIEDDRRSYWHRTCSRCQKAQEFVAVPAAPGAFTAWIDI